MVRPGACRRRPVAFVACVLVALATACTTNGGVDRPADKAERVGQRVDQGVSVRSFGARGDGSTDDAAAFQAAVDSLAGKGGTVTVPAGVYRMASAVVLRHNNVAIRGVGPGSQLKLADGAKTNIFVMPAPFGTSTADLFVSNIEISDLTLDGNRNGGPRDTPTFFGIQIRRAEHVRLSHLLMRDWPFDAISVGVGEKPNVDIAIRNSRFVGIGRNAIHLGYGTNLRVSEVLVEDTPSQQWGPAAGNAIDIEVEGQNSFVDGFVIENSVFVRAGTKTAGYGVALQPAFGPIRNGVIRGNVIRNHQHGVFVGRAENISVENNWVLADDNLSTGAGITVYDGAARVEGNVLNLLRWPLHGYAGLLIHGATSPLTIKGNEVWGGQCTVRVEAAGQPLSFVDNDWGNDSGCFVDAGAPPAAVSQTGNERRQVTALDSTPPTLGLEVVSGLVRANVQDLGAGVARVLFLVDGLPYKFVGGGSFDVPLSDLRLADGPHLVEAMALDMAANVSGFASLAVRGPS